MPVDADPARSGRGAHVLADEAASFQAVNLTLSFGDLRRRVGMLFQRPNPFPMSIMENVVRGAGAPAGRPQGPEGDRQAPARRGGALGCRRGPAE
jgi:ABC-type polar amino acid transport system ATPase subunit